MDLTNLNSNPKESLTIEQLNEALADSTSADIANDGTDITSTIGGGDASRDASEDVTSATDTSYATGEDTSEEGAYSKDELKRLLQEKTDELESLTSQIRTLENENKGLKKRFADSQSFITTLREVNNRIENNDTKKTQDLASAYVTVKHLGEQFKAVTGAFEETPEELLTIMKQIDNIVEDINSKSGNAVKANISDKLFSIQAQLCTNSKERTFLEEVLLGDNDPVKVRRFMDMDKQNINILAKSYLEAFREKQEADSMGVEVGAFAELKRGLEEERKARIALEKELAEYKRPSGKQAPRILGKQTPRAGNTIPKVVSGTEEDITPLQAMFAGRMYQ